MNNNINNNNIQSSTSLKLKKQKVYGFLNIMINPGWNYGDPPITDKEYGYIKKLVNQLNLNKVNMGSNYSLSDFLNDIIIPYLNAIRSKCGNNELLPQCEVNIKEELQKVTETLMTNPLFVSIPQNTTVTNDLSTQTSSGESQNETFYGNNADNKIQNLLNSLAPTDSVNVVSVTDTDTDTTASPVGDVHSKIEELINEQDSYKPNLESSMDIFSSSALAVGEPKFEDQVDADAPYFETRYKSLTKQNQIIILDLDNTTANPISLTDFSCNLQDNLIISGETDVYLEFISLHNIHGNSTSASRINLETFHCFTLNIREFNRYYTSFSNRSDLSGQIIIPNDSFGYQDEGVEEIIDSGVAGGGSTTTIVLSSGSSSVDDFYNNYYVIITGGTGEGQIRKITDYVGSSLTATVATWTATDTTSTYNITKEPTPRRVLTSQSVKLKSNFLFTMNPDKVQDLTVTFKGLQMGNTVTEDLYLADINSRVQIGILFKQR
jgi:hypothetical protein